MAGNLSDIEPKRDGLDEHHGTTVSRSAREAALAAIRLGHVYLESDSYSDAIECFVRAETGGLGSALTEAEAAGLCTSIARCYLGLGEHDEARTYADRAQDLGNRCGAGTRCAEAQVILARIEARSGRFREALESAQKAYDTLKRGPDSSLLAEAAKVLGTAHAELGNTTAARDSLVDCLVCNRRLGDDAGVAGAYNNLGILAKRSGDLVAAVDCFERALEIDTGLGRPASIARRLNNLGLALYRLSRWTEAQEHLSRAWEIYSRLGAARDVVAVESALGNLCRVRREWGKARTYFERVLRTSREAGYLRAEALALEFLGDLEIDRGNCGEALRTLDRALECAHRLSSNSDVVAEVLRRRAEALLALGRFGEAEQDCSRALTLSRRIGDRLEEGATLRVMASVCYAMGRRSRAHALSAQAEEVLRSTGESFELARTALADAIGLSQSFSMDELSIERVEARLSMAEALFAGIGAAHLVATCRLERAKALCKAGQHGRGRSWLDSACDEFERAGDRDGLVECDGLRRRLDEELAVAGAAPPEKYSVIAEGHRLLQAVEAGVEAVHGFASSIAEMVSADRLVLFSLEEDRAPLVVMSVDRTGRRLAEVKRLVRSVAGEPGALKPLVACGEGAGGRVPAGVAAVALIPAEVSVESGGRYLLYADRLAGARAAAFSESDVEFVGAAARMLGRIHGRTRTNTDTPGDYAEGAAARSRMVTCDPGMLAILASVERLRDSAIPVVILGESGVGKEVFARAIHDGGRSRTGRFVALNSGAIPPHLQESELFGHVKGAFTDADRDRKGLVEVAAGGTLFLDEIGEMTQELQVKLLRFLQSGEFRRVGESTTRTSDARVVSASNKDLRREVEAGRFRRDLFYRLNGFVVDVPPLRERPRDVPLLMEHFLKIYCELEGKHVLGFSPDVRDIFLRHDWRGNNVRELENEIRRGVALCEDGGVIGLDEIRPELRANHRAVRRSAEGGGRCLRSLRDEVEALEKRRIHEALDRSGHSKRRAAKDLGVSRTGLYTKLRKYGMS